MSNFRLRILVASDDGSHPYTITCTRTGEEIEVLADPDGQVMLVGEDFLWTNKGPPRTTGGIQMEAKLLRDDF